MASSYPPAPSDAAQRRRWSLIWGLLVASSAIYFLSDNTADNDLWVHLRAGLDILSSGRVPRLDAYSYTVAGHAWVDHEWLTQAAFGAAFRRFGSAGLMGLKLILGGGAVLLLGRRTARRSRNPHVWGPLLILALAVLARGFAVRPQLTTYLLVALLLWLLDRAPRRPRAVAAALVILFVLWANAHGAFILGIGISGLAVAGMWTDQRRVALWLATATAAGALLALMLNPYGPSLATYLWHELSGPHPITEWQPISWELAQGTFLALVAVFVTTLPFTESWRRDGWQVALAAGLVVLAFRQQRHTPLFALAVTPLAAAQVDAAVRRFAAPRRRPLSAGARRLLIAGMAGIATLQLLLAGARLGRDHMQLVFAADDYPVGAVRYLRQSGAGGNLAVPLEWGAYALWHLEPHVRVSLDGRFATVYPAAVVQTNFAFFAGRPGWRALLDDYPTDLALAPAYAPPPVSGLPRWRRAYSDAVAVLFVRRGSAADAALVGPPPAPPPRGAVMPFP